MMLLYLLHYRWLLDFFMERHALKGGKHSDHMYNPQKGSLVVVLA